MTKQGILLINLGTPEQCDASSVRRYLREFLIDPRVIDLPLFMRWPLVNLGIVPFRYKKTLAAYQQIWTEQGSPLLVNSESIRDDLAVKLGAAYQVELAMRYGTPDIASAVARLQACESLMVIPLFPQYSSAANGSAIEKALLDISGKWNVPALRVRQDFYNDAGFIAAVAENIRVSLQDKTIDKIIFSYHGLPERHINKSDCVANCDRVHSCPPITDANRYCYRAQCYASSAAIADVLGLGADDYVVSFQSRLGRTPWIKPYTDLLLPELIADGVRDIAVVSPSFVADCLETLEEINIRTRKQWMALGGGEFVYIPCVNQSDVWIQSLADWVVATV